MNVKNSKVNFIRKEGYNNLAEVCGNCNNEYIGRKGIVFINNVRYPTKNSIWANPYKVDKFNTLKDILDKYEEYIIDKGGHIYIALYNGEAVGACALIKMDDKKFELAKMAVSPKAQGKSIGTLLGLACIEKAKELGGDTLFLESNTRLKPAISLYRKLGFEKITGPPSPYERANIQMELKLR